MNISQSTKVDFVPIAAVSTACLAAGAAVSTAVVKEINIIGFGISDEFAVSTARYF